jgi:hypothetical protein
MTEPLVKCVPNTDKFIKELTFGSRKNTELASTSDAQNDHQYITSLARGFEVLSVFGQKTRELVMLNWHVERGSQNQHCRV